VTSDEVADGAETAETAETADTAGGADRAEGAHGAGDRVAAMRRSYSSRGLDEADLDPDPMRQFASWLDAADASGLVEPNAMVVATADAAGRPSARTVLLKGLDAGFVFYTNYDSRKGRELTTNPWAALVFGWYPLERQVLVTGEVERVDRETSRRYFDSRPYGSRLGAASSPQSRVVGSRGDLDAAYAAAAARWPDGGEVPLPDDWGGFRVIPETVEFWQGRKDRQHDRLRYRRDGELWLLERLAP
jgi:pyridoxamine 5'-phosphate oxidase